MLPLQSWCGLALDFHRRYPTSDSLVLSETQIHKRLISLWIGAIILHWSPKWYKGLYVDHKLLKFINHFLCDIGLKLLIEHANVFAFLVYNLKRTNKHNMNWNPNTLVLCQRPSKLVKIVILAPFSVINSSNSLDPIRRSYSASHPDPSCLHTALWSW